MPEINPPQTHERRYDLDWLRVVAFAILIFFHAAVAFIPDGLPLTLNAQPSHALTIMVAFLHQFRLALLFFVSGCGAYFAMRKRNRNAFLRERSSRLLLPLLFGITVLVPIMVYFEMRYIGRFSGNFIDFYERYFVSGVYPNGYLSWHHFWFLAYLFLFCLLGWPMFSYWQRANWFAKNDEFMARFRLDANGIYLLILPLFLIEVILRPIFPGFRDLIHDWASFSHWFVIFLVGFLFAGERRLLEAARIKRWVSLWSATLLTFVLFTFFWHPEQGHLYPFSDQTTEASSMILRFAVFSLIRVAHAWCWILVCVGFAAQHLNRPGTLVVELNRAVYPTFCLHLPILVVLEFYVLPLSWSIASKFLVISVTTLLLLILFYYLLRPLKILHPWLGYKVE